MLKPFFRVPMGKATIGKHEVLGLQLSSCAGCAHYATPLDIIAIRFKCCQKYWACIACHEALAGHAAQVWPADAFDKKAVLCRRCEEELTIGEYLTCNAQCPKCHAFFNPRCVLHWKSYFKTGYTIYEN